MHAANLYRPPQSPPAGASQLARERHRRIVTAWHEDAKVRGEDAEAQAEVERLRDRGALFAVSHSGGKDSQAALIAVRKVVPDSQIVVVHAPLRHVEWEGSAEVARKETPRGRPFLLAEKYDLHGEEVWLLERVVQKRKWPNAANRWCTSEWKSGPISREIRKYADEHGHTLIVEVWGLRAEESAKRALQPPLSRSKHHGVRSVVLGSPREWYVWLPIKWSSTDGVFDSIERSGKKPLWTYQEGMTRASCALCVLASLADLRTAARLAPDIYALYVAIERWIGEENEAEARRTGKRPEPGTIHRRSGNKPYPLEDFTGISPDERLVERFLRSIRKTGDLREVRLPAQVPRLSAARLREISQLRQQERVVRTPQLPLFSEVDGE